MHRKERRTYGCGSGNRRISFNKLLSHITVNRRAIFSQKHLNLFVHNKFPLILT